MADRALIEAAGRLAKSEMPVDIAGEFIKTFMPAVEKAEKEKQAVQNEVAGYMANLKSDIDFTSLVPEMEKEVRRYLTESRNEFNELANKVARIEDHSSEEYQNSINRMNDIQREFATLASELTTYNQEKINTADMFNQHTYSDGWAMGHPKDFALHKNIYGLSEQGMSPVSIKNGHLFFGTEDGEIRYSNIKAIPGKATAAIETVLSGAAKASRSRVAMTQEEINQQTYVLNQAFQDPNVFVSVLFDAPEGTLPLMQVQEDYIKARDNGTLEDVMPQLINDAVSAIVNGYETTALQSSEAYKANVANDKPSGYSGEGAYMMSHYNANRPFIPYPRTANIGYFMVEKGGKRITGSGTGGVYTEEDKKKAVGYQRFVKDKNGAWITDGTYPVVPLNNPKEFYLQNNNIIKYS